ncbi:hypothetical protein OSTOST_04611 [Ostertagia ostertagi]
MESQHRGPVEPLRTSDSSTTWRMNEERQSILQWATTSVYTSENGKLTYYRCSRAMPFPMYALTRGGRSKKSTRYCTAFLKVLESDSMITVTFCNKHFGHEEEPALLRLDKDSERYIVGLLREGYNTNQILRKIRTECRNQEKRMRLYYTTAMDVR